MKEKKNCQRCTGYHIFGVCPVNQIEPSDSRKKTRRPEGVASTFLFHFPPHLHGTSSPSSNPVPLSLFLSVSPPLSLCKGPFEEEVFRVREASPCSRAVSECPAENS